MVRVIGVRFRPAGKVYYFSASGIALQTGDAVIVETARGVEYGKVVMEEREVDDEKIVPPLKKVIRKADTRDLEALDSNHQREQEALEICKRKVVDHHLPMRLVDVEYTFDLGKIIFYFTSESRVDFRELVKDLAGVFKTRIELRQIGVRDEAKLLGGIGTCGRVLCCHQFLDDFAPVSIKMAKEQRLSLNPAKISGVCGRLMCCLKYESELYENNQIPLRREENVVLEIIELNDAMGEIPQEQELKVNEKRNSNNHTGTKELNQRSNAGNGRSERKGRSSGKQQPSS